MEDDRIVKVRVSFYFGGERLKVVVVLESGGSFWEGRSLGREL